MQVENRVFVITHLCFNRSAQNCLKQFCGCWGKYLEVCGCSQLHLNLFHTCCMIVQGCFLNLTGMFSGFFQAALRQITDKAREFGAGPLFNQILPLLMSPTLEDQERHLLVKVIDRILYKLDDLVRPYVHKVCCSLLFHL